MNISRLRLNSAFTLVELLIGMSLGLFVMAAVISCFVFLSRSMARLQLHQQFDAQGRRALLYFAQDARMAGSISFSPLLPTGSNFSFTIPTSSGTTNINYGYDSVSGTLTRTDLNTSSSVVLLNNLTSFRFDYYDSNRNLCVTAHRGQLLPFLAYYDVNDALIPSGQYPALANYLIGIKAVAMSFRTQSSASWNLTQPVFTYQMSSPRVILRNRRILP